MEKKIEDYLHLYLGSEVVGIYDDKPRKGYLTGVGNGGYDVEIQFFEDDGINVFENPEYNSFEQVKLLLRESDTMTEEEAIQSAKLTEYEPHFNDVKVFRSDYNDLIVTWQGSNEKRERLNATGEYFYCPDQFQWLLKNSFDLFHLVEDGLAHNKSTFKL